MRRLLVTGGAGFIGANFVRYWIDQYPGDRIVVLDALTYAGNRDNLPEEDAANWRFVHGDVADEDRVRSLLIDESLDTIVHFAAESHVDRSIHDPDAFIRTNVFGTSSLLRAAKIAWLDSESAPASHLFHQVSTDEVYGSLGPDDPPFTERTPYAPNSPYAASKAAADHLVRAYHHTYGLRTTTSNCSNNYGPYQFPEKLIPLMVVNALEGKPMPVYGDGSNIRDWLYVEDHCRGIELVINRGSVGETYNLGGGAECSNIDIVNLICDALDQAFARDEALHRRFPRSPAASGASARKLITFVRDRPGHDWRYAIDAGKAQRDIGYRAQEHFRSGLDRTIGWMLANEAWWRAVVDGSYREWVSRHYGSAR